MSPYERQSSADSTSLLDFVSLLFLSIFSSSPLIGMPFDRAHCPTRNFNKDGPLSFDWLTHDTLKKKRIHVHTSVVASMFIHCASNDSPALEGFILGGVAECKLDGGAFLPGLNGF